MHFRYFSSFFGVLVLPLSASFGEVWNVSVHYLISAWISYTFLSWAQCSRPTCWVLRGTIWSQDIPFKFLGSPSSSLRHRCSSNLLSHNPIRWKIVLVMLTLMAIPALRVCELVPKLIRVYNYFSEIIQIARKVDHLSWKSYTEMVSPTYQLFSTSF